MPSQTIDFQRLEQVQPTRPFSTGLALFFIFFLFFFLLHVEMHQSLCIGVAIHQRGSGGWERGGGGEEGSAGNVGVGSAD